MFESAISLAQSSGDIIITDGSNYTEGLEDGHALANFSDFAYIKITLPDGTVYKMGTVAYQLTYGSYNSLMQTPDIALENTYFDSFGGGLFKDLPVYTVELFTVPTYSALASYVQNNDQKIYYNGAIWQPMSNGNLSAPVAGPDWIDVTDLFLSTPDRYSSSAKIATTHEIQEKVDVMGRRLNNLGTVIAPVYERYLKQVMAYDYTRLKLALGIISTLVALDEDARVINVFNQARGLISKYE